MCYSTSCAGNCRGRACKRFINYQCVFGQSVYVMVQLLFLFLGGGGIACVHVCAFPHECTCMCFPLTRAQDCVLGHTSIHMMHIQRICARAYAHTHVAHTCTYVHVRMHTHMYSYFLREYICKCVCTHSCIRMLCIRMLCALTPTHVHSHTIAHTHSLQANQKDKYHKILWHHLPEKAKHSHQRPL